eukprot:gnl/Hemi2/19226_TR6379_c0_g1_i1.p1 gnl/Hemi2/19226_TR6379_c0_g1~~gnl/Hemi2/19226_TR6379_c0_g1_i1.p1  ORF type:complete len:381 (+),score=69.88 gnl/Hemi2/19226_TR6379_c0_g1_i1:121-1263(+)
MDVEGYSTHISIAAQTIVTPPTAIVAVATPYNTVALRAQLNNSSSALHHHDDGSDSEREVDVESQPPAPPPTAQTAAEQDLANQAQRPAEILARFAEHWLFRSSIVIGGFLMVIGTSLFLGVTVAFVAGAVAFVGGLASVLAGVKRDRQYITMNMVICVIASIVLIVLSIYCSVLTSVVQRCTACDTSLTDAQCHRRQQQDGTDCSYSCSGSGCTTVLGIYAAMTGLCWAATFLTILTASFSCCCGSDPFRVAADSLESVLPGMAIPVAYPATDSSPPPAGPAITGFEIVSGECYGPYSQPPTRPASVALPPAASGPATTATATSTSTSSATSTSSSTATTTAPPSSAANSGVGLSPYSPFPPSRPLSPAVAAPASASPD